MTVETGFQGLYNSRQNDEPLRSRFYKSNGSASKRSGDASRVEYAVVPGRYKIAIGILLVFLVMASLFFFQQLNAVQFKNGQLSSQSSDLRNNLTGLTKIINLQESQTLSDNHFISLTAETVSLNLTCQCFQYSGYLHVTWRSSASLMLRVVQFELNLDTPSRGVGDFKIPISRNFDGQITAYLVATGCLIPDQCTATYSVVYHY